MQKMISVALALSFITVLGSTQANAADWQPVAKDARSKSTYYVDTSSIRRTSSTVRFWIQTTYVNDKDGWESSKSYHEVDCAERRMRQLASTVYYKDGRNSSGANGPNPWTYVTPESIGEILLDYACANS